MSNGLLVRMSVCRSVCPFVRTFVRPSLRLYAHMSVCPSTRLSVCAFVLLSVCPYVRMSVFPSVRMYVCPYARLSGSPYVCLHVCSYVRMRGGVSTIRPGKDGIAATSSRMLVVFAAATDGGSGLGPRNSVRTEDLVEICPEMRPGTAEAAGISQIWPAEGRIAAKSSRKSVQFAAETGRGSGRRPRKPVWMEDLVESCPEMRSGKAGSAKIGRS